MLKKFPIIIKQPFLNKKLYSELEEDFDNVFSKNFNKAKSFNQKFRKNLLITKKNKNKLLKRNKSFLKLFNILNSKKTRIKHYKNFKNHIKKSGFLLDFKSIILESELEVSIAIAYTDYENPFHIDTRKRIIHGLSYFKVNEFKGGEFEIAKIKKRKLSEYPQIPHLSEIVARKKIFPKSNVSYEILSTPYSYHKGCKSIGIRRFIYYAYNYKKKKVWPESYYFNYILNFELAKKFQNSNILISNIFFKIFILIKKILKKLDQK